MTHPYSARARQGRALLSTLVVPALALTNPVAAIAATTTELSSVEVVGRSVSGTYAADEAYGAKTQLPLRELPQSVRVVTRQAIDDLGATRLDDVLDYVGGVSRQNNFGGLWDNVAIRGLPGNENTGMATLFNGFSANRGFNAPRDLAGADRVEFLKGPAAALYGASEPGGTLNLVSKRPLWKAGNAAEAYYGTYGLKRGSVDTTGPLSRQLAYRLNAAVEDRNSFRDFVQLQRQVLAPALSWHPGAATTVDYVGEYLDQKTPLDRGVVAVNNALGAIPRDRFLGEPADGDMRSTNQTHQVSVVHEWSPQWRSRAALSYRETALEGYSTEATALRSDGTLTRQRRYRDYDSDDIALQAELIGTLNGWGLGHELLVGFETYRFDMDQLMLRINPTTAAPYAINIYNPVYGQPQPTLLPNTNTVETQRTLALYTQDVITLAPRWRLLLGTRVDRYQQSLANLRTGVTTEQDPVAVSPRGGLSWLPSAQWTVYANGGQSYRPNNGVDAQSRPFDPERGLALEVGAKWESTDHRLGATAALFDIRKDNVLTADPNNAGASIAAGEVRSTGLEFDLSGQLTRHLRLNAALVLDEVRVTKDNTLQTDGLLLNVPRINGSVLAVYEQPLAHGGRVGLGGGVTHTGERLGQARTQAEFNAGTAAFELPAYTTAKLLGYWNLNPRVRLMLDVDNVFDATYYTSSFSRVWVTPGNARLITAGVQARF